MGKAKKIGIIICDRYRDCAGGKCFRSLKNREGAFSMYGNMEVEVVGYTSCGGCPGGNVEYATAEMIKNGAEVIHFATGLIVGYPPCPYLEHFRNFLSEHYHIDSIPGTHPIPQKYYETHKKLGTWESGSWQDLIQPVLADEDTRRAYD